MVQTFLHIDLCALVWKDMYPVVKILEWKLGTYTFLINITKWLLEKEMATHSNTFAREIPWTEEACGLQSMVSLESDII